MTGAGQNSVSLPRNWATASLCLHEAGSATGRHLTALRRKTPHDPAGPHLFARPLTRRQSDRPWSGSQPRCFSNLNDRVASSWVRHPQSKQFFQIPSSENIDISYRTIMYLIPSTYSIRYIQCAMYIYIYTYNYNNYLDILMSHTHIHIYIYKYINI